jgi:cell division protein FtsB
MASIAYAPVGDLLCDAPLDAESVFEGLSIGNSDLGLDQPALAQHTDFFDCVTSSGHALPSSFNPLAQLRASVKQEPVDPFLMDTSDRHTTLYGAPPSPSSPGPSAPQRHSRSSSAGSGSSSADEQLSCDVAMCDSILPALHEAEEQQTQDERNASTISTSPTAMWTPVHIPSLNVDEAELSAVLNRTRSQRARTTRRTRSCSPSAQDEQLNSSCQANSRPHAVKQEQGGKRKRLSSVCARSRARSSSCDDDDDVDDDDDAAFLGMPSDCESAVLRTFFADASQHCRVKLSRTDLLRVSSAEFEHFVSEANLRSELSGTELREVKRQRRLVKNRESALASRNRRKAELQELRDQVDSLEDQKHELNARVAELENENTQLKAEVFQLHQLLSQARTGVGNLVSALTSVGGRARHNPAAGVALMVMLFSFGLFFQDPSAYLLGGSLSPGAPLMPLADGALHPLALASSQQPAVREQLAEHSPQQLDLFRRSSTNLPPSGRSLMSTAVAGASDPSVSALEHRVAQAVPVVLLEESSCNSTASPPLNEVGASTAAGRLLGQSCKELACSGSVMFAS